MKTFVRVCAFVLLVALTACQKEMSLESGPAGNPGAGSVNGTLKMKIDGVQWVADKVAGASIMAKYTNITGVSKDGKTFTITINDTVPGKFRLTPLYPIDSLHFAALSDSMVFNNGSWGTMQGTDESKAGGTVTITQIDKVNKKIKGSFQLKLFNLASGVQKVITDGEFDLAYTTEMPSAATSDTLNVKINGTKWTGESIFSTAVTVPSSQLTIIANTRTIDKTVGLFMPLNITPGTYDLSFFNLTYFGQYNANPTTAMFADSGKMTILEHNTTTKRIRGNFNFVAQSITGTPAPVNLTEGYFSVTYK